MKRLLGSIALSVSANLFGCSGPECNRTGSWVSAENPNDGADGSTPVVPTSFLHGLWEGVGIASGHDGQEHLTSMECLYPKLDGAVTVVEGKHVNEQGAESFKTFGVLSSKSSLSYDFNVYLKNGFSQNGYEGIFPAEVDPAAKTWKWSRTFNIPRQDGSTIEGKVRYLITVSNQTWTEIGEMSMDDGTTWVQNFEMKLNRTSTSCRGLSSDRK